MMISKLCGIEKINKTKISKITNIRLLNVHGQGA